MQDAHDDSRQSGIRRPQLKASSVAAVLATAAEVANLHCREQQWKTLREGTPLMDDAGDTMAVTDSREPIPDVVDAEQPTEQESFGRWLEDFDRLSIPEGIGRSLAAWAHDGYQQLPHEVGWQIRRAILYLFYLFLVPLSNKGFSATPSVDELAQEAFRKAQASTGQPEEAGPAEPEGPSARVDAPDSSNQGPISVDTEREARAESSSSSPELNQQFSDEQARHFLTHLEGSVKAATHAAEKDAEIMRGREQTLFRVFLAAAVVTFVFAAAGIALIFTGSLAVGIVSAAIAIFPGSGTAILRGMRKQQQAARTAKSAAADEDRHVWQAVQAAMMIPDPQQRNVAMVQLAERFASRI